MLTRQRRSTGKTSTGNNFLENIREFPEMVTSTGLQLAPPPTHRVSRALRAREPRKSPKRVPKEYPGTGPQKSERVRPGVPKESEKSLKPDFWTLFGLFWDSGAHSFGTFGALSRGTLSGLFPDSSGVLGPEGPGRPCVGRGQLQVLVLNFGYAFAVQYWYW